MQLKGLGDVLHFPILTACLELLNIIALFELDSHLCQIELPHLESLDPYLVQGLLGCAVVDRHAIAVVVHVQDKILSHDGETDQRDVRAGCIAHVRLAPSIGIE